MRAPVRIVFVCLLAVSTRAAAQSFPSEDPVIRAIWEEGVERSQVRELGQVMMDSIGPRLTGSPAMAGANDWALAKYAEWGIEAYKQQYGTWRGWERGITHIDLIAPRVRSLEGMAAAWSPATDGPVEGAVVILPHADSPGAFQASLSELRGKFVLISRPEPSCRAPDNLDQFARPETTARMMVERERAIAEWNDRVGNTGFDQRSLPEVLSVAEPAAVIRSQWSEGWGVTKIFGTRAQRAPVLDLSCEAYGLLYRLAENDQGPVLRVDVQARFLGEVPVSNAFAVIPGSAEPEEYVILGGHYDSWDGADGALDNGTGAVAIMEAMRILKSAVPNPRRTIIGALWNGEEQGLNGSRAFVEDNPEILERTHTVFNVDHGNGPVTFIPMQGFAAAAGALRRVAGRGSERTGGPGHARDSGNARVRRNGPRFLPVRGRAGVQLSRGRRPRRQVHRRQPMGHEHLYLAHQPRHLRQDRVRGPARRRCDDRDVRLSGVGRRGDDAAGRGGRCRRGRSGRECRPPARSSGESAR